MHSNTQSIAPKNQRFISNAGRPIYDALVTSMSSEPRELKLILAHETMQTMLQNYRRELNGYLSREEYAVLLTCLKGKLAESTSGNHMASTVLNHDPARTELADKIRALSNGGCLGLADLIDRSWYHHISGTADPASVPSGYGVQFSDQ